ncbi:U32 family peptidase [Alicyclobacillus cycloheptanicus]|uniref:NAD(P)H-dependent flavin oxidoreductase YrpB (Nitropropane dioxygenase family) n=1 Tax=Alicyclobacillus cycloheptanicus TaxID=1457 RepID=A0ABT9XGV6_9BACL|nr:U32 family peptidase [Alicyclobacillus cycloheptanicus]MDQ0189523.1 NAD(P)H-dependent flavin oxidoreductase YrpB (nitropropane dioxygenase family) [Alicyclobacillus cycloheptanicus]WDM01583.1 U32 family peptidase [Alicyclobacillus cycloheptanicus]
MFDESRAALTKIGLPASDDAAWQASAKRFADGAQVRVEIPSCEGPEVLRAVLEEAERLDVRLHRISQGSGIMLMTDSEIREMAKLGAEAGIEISLFIGPRAGWHLSALAKSETGGIAKSRAMGMEQIVQSVEEVKRAHGLGIRSVLVSDEGLLWVLGELRKRGDLPADMKYKVSVMAGVTNPATAAVLERFGANTLNVATDLTLAQLAAVRSVTNVPLDIYVEVPDDVGGFVRYYEIPELIRLASPVYIKFGVRNAPNIYPSGEHLKDLAVKLGRERVRRARIGLELLDRYFPEARMSVPGQRADDLAVPVV